MTDFGNHRSHGWDKGLTQPIDLQARALFLSQLVEGPTFEELEAFQLSRLCRSAKTAAITRKGEVGALLGLTTRFDAARDEDGPGYHPEFGNSVAFGHDLFRNLFGYVEFFSRVSTERDAEWIGTFDTGLIWVLTDNLQLSAGVNIGVTRAADDWSPFIGMSWRF